MAKRAELVTPRTSPDRRVSGVVLKKPVESEVRHAIRPPSFSPERAVLPREMLHLCHEFQVFLLEKAKIDEGDDELSSETIYWLEEFLVEHGAETMENVFKAVVVPKDKKDLRDRVFAFLSEDPSYRNKMMETARLAHDVYWGKAPPPSATYNPFDDLPPVSIDSQFPTQS